MRSHLFFAVLVLSLTPVSAVYSQDDLPPVGQQAPPRAGVPGARPVNPDAADPLAYRSQVSYALGRNFAMNLRDNEIECDLNSLVAGIQEVLSNAQPKWTEAQLDACLQRFGQEMQQKAMTRMQQQAGKNQQEAADFLTKNAKVEGVQSTPSGLQYRVLKQGNGPSPTISDMVRCNYRGTLLNGNEFDSSAKHGGAAQFAVNRVIPGWTEALQKMHVGDKWQLFVPPKLAYDMDPPSPAIQPGSLLVFEIELLEIVKK